MTDWRSTPAPIRPSTWTFPAAETWPDADLVAMGADLEPSTLVAAYRHGLFPMGLPAARPVMGWWSPDPRGILPLDGLRVTKTMRRSAARYEVRVDTRFEEVMRGCADPSRPGAWITGEFIRAYTELHRLGWAHSVEAFDAAGELAGGLYGVKINGLFAGESMFHRARDASKVALMALVDLMRGTGMTLLDVQWRTDHLESLGAIDIRRARYLALLADAVGEG